MLVNFTFRNTINLAVLVVAVFAAIFSGLALSSVIIIGILSMVVMYLFWVALDLAEPVAREQVDAMSDRESAEEYLVRRRERIAERGRNLDGRS